MKYSLLAETYNQLEREPGTLRKVEILSSLFKKSPKNEIGIIALLANGRVFPSWSPKKLDFGKQMIIATLSKVTGRSKRVILDKIKEKGDVGEAAFSILDEKSQSTLFSQTLTVDRVFSNLRKMAEIEGEGSVDKKIGLVAELLSSASALEAKYITRTVTEELRIGVGEGVSRKAIASAFDVDEKSVERAYSLTNDYAEVAKSAAITGDAGLKKMKIEVGRPLKVMLAYKSESMKDALEKLGGKAAVEFKFDGFRVQIHKRKKEVSVFTRRLEDVTEQFPDIVEAAKNAIKRDNVILEGEAVGFREKRFLPFQNVSRRIRRKYDIEKMAEKIPVKTFLFDILYLERSLLNEPFSKRRELLERVIEPVEGMDLTEQLITEKAKEGKRYYLDAVGKGLEGVMVKNLDSPYKPGSRVGHMLKLKPTMETLDLAIIGAEWGEGRRQSWLGSFILGVNTPEGLKPIGKMATGLTDFQFEEMTEKLKPLIKNDNGKVVEVLPEVVVEVAYEEIQSSTNYESGYALRFPRMVRVREDKGIEDADNLERVEHLYSEQRGQI